MTDKREIKQFIDEILIFVVLSIVGLCAYCSVLYGEFLSDDFRYIVCNNAITDISNLKSLFRAFNTRFIVGLTFAFNYYLDGLNVFGYHLFNIVVHIFNSWLVYIFICKTLHICHVIEREYQKVSAIICSLVFLLHPIQTQAVSFIGQRATIMACSLILLSLILYIKARLEQSNLCFGFVGVLLVAGFFIKEIVLVIPVLILCYEVYFLFDLSGKNKFRWIAGYFAMLMLFPMILRASREHSTIYFQYLISIDHFSWNYFLTEINVLISYLRLLFIPLNQAVEHQYPISTGIFDMRTILSIVGVLTLILYMILQYRKNRLLSFSILWFFVTKSIEFLSVSFGNRNVIYENWLYVSVVGWALFLAVILAKIQKRFVYILVVCVMLNSFLYLTLQRNKVWSNEAIHYQDLIIKYPTYVISYLGLSDAYNRKGDLKRAEAVLKKAIEVRPDYFQFYHNLAVIFGKTYRDDLAIEYFKKAIAINPQDSSSLYNLGFMYYLNHDDQKAKYWIEKSLAIEPNSNKAQDLLGKLK